MGHRRARADAPPRSERAKALKGARFALWKNPQDLTEGQQAKLAWVAATDPRAVSAAVPVETNVDDLDPRVWPMVLAHLLQGGASDAWLAPILMKKGRPRHTLSVLAEPRQLPALRELVFRETSAIGLRATSATKHALARTWVPVAVAGGRVRIKVAVSDGSIIHSTPEFDDVMQVAVRVSRPVRDVLETAAAAAGSYRASLLWARSAPRPSAPLSESAKCPAPYPLSMLTTTTPGAHELSIANSAATPPNDAP